MPCLHDTVRCFNRFELKYLLTLQEAETFKAGLRSYMLPDEHGNNNGRYSLTSLYYDSPDYRCYREKMDGLRFRRKLRIRSYDSDEVLTEESPVVVEIKQRVDRVTQKWRTVMPYGDALRLCDDREIPDHDPRDEDFINEIYAFLWQYNLHPSSIVRYDRQAFIGTQYDIGLRVTFDTSLSFQTYPLYLHEQPTNLPMMAPNKVVLEIKVNERMPHWIVEMIKRHNLQLVRISKYCHSIEAAQSIPSMRWRNLTGECSQEVLSTSLSAFTTLQRQMGIKH